MKTKSKLFIVFSALILILLAAPHNSDYIIHDALTNMIISFVFIYIGYWFVYRNADMYNSFILIRYKSKAAFCKSYVKEELLRIIRFVCGFVSVSLIIEYFAQLIRPRDTYDNTTSNYIASILIFIAFSIINLVLLRLLGLLISMSTRKLAGDIFYIAYVVGSVVWAWFTCNNVRTVNVSILTVFCNFRTFKWPGYIGSYIFITALIVIFGIKVKKGSVRV